MDRTECHRQWHRKQSSLGSRSLVEPPYVAPPSARKGEAPTLGSIDRHAHLKGTITRDARSPHRRGVYRRRRLGGRIRDNLGRIRGNLGRIRDHLAI